MQDDILPKDEDEILDDGLLDPLAPSVAGLVIDDEESDTVDIDALADEEDEDDLEEDDM
ncbi:MAG: hypothetical protein AB200_02250 [Parcubacteria bacterium C7867-005]|nr:MAG: hypothetical protein AB200_02250 [Parcubacteria bacterium C7867-005]